MENKPKLSECEEMIMSILWNDDEDLDLQSATDQIKTKYGKEWKLQTVDTFIKRLQKKGYINIYRVGRYSHYQPVVKLHDYRKQKFREMSELLLFDSTADMVNFIKNM